MKVRVEVARRDPQFAPGGPMGRDTLGPVGGRCMDPTGEWGRQQRCGSKVNWGRVEGGGGGGLPSRFANACPTRFLEDFLRTSPGFLTRVLKKGS